MKNFSSLSEIQASLSEGSVSCKSLVSYYLDRIENHKDLNIYLEVLENYLGYRPKVLLQDLPDFFKHHTTKYQVIYDRLYDRKFNNSKILNFIKQKEFNSSFTYSNTQSKFDLSQYQKNIESNLINEISEKIFIYLRT